MDSKHLGKDDWLRAARTALLQGGPDAVRVEKLARTLNVTKGSFYWHFKDREEILEALLLEWEEETSSLLDDALRERNPRRAIAALFEDVHRRVILSERGGAPSDAAIFAWASMSPRVAERVNKVERQRILFLGQITGLPDRAELVYYAYLGFILRRRRVPEAAESFPLLASMLVDLLSPPGRARKSQTKKSKSKRAHEKVDLRSRTR